MTMQIRDRVKEFRKVKASSLVACPWNWRTHPKEQREVLQGIFSEVGFAGSLLTRELPDKRLMLIDGHLRREELGDQEVNVAVTDLTEEEALKLLMCYDPLSQMAGVDKEQLGKNLQQVKTKSQALAYLFNELKDANEVSFGSGELELDMEEGDEEETTVSVITSTADNIEPSHVRMVQLFLSTATIGNFQLQVQQLGQRYNTKSLTDTIIEAVKREYELLKEENEETVNAGNSPDILPF